MSGVCSVSFIVCVVRVLFLFERGVLYCVLYLVVVPLPQGKPPICSQNKEQ
jgi:hypothetical protein